MVILCTFVNYKISWITINILGSTDCKKNKYGEGKPVKEIAIIGAGLMGAGGSRADGNGIR